MSKHEGGKNTGHDLDNKVGGHSTKSTPHKGHHPRSDHENASYKKHISVEEMAEKGHKYGEGSK